MSEALKNCQRPEDGLWNPSLVSYADFGGKEMSGTALFLYGMAWGIQKGYLKSTIYKPVCDKAWEVWCTTVYIPTDSSDGHRVLARILQQDNPSLTLKCPTSRTMVQVAFSSVVLNITIS